jgi:ABC-type polysaccharide/polyol phosphate export permease
VRITPDLLFVEITERSLHYYFQNICCLSDWCIITKILYLLEEELSPFRKFIFDIKKYREYIYNSFLTELALENSRSYLGFLWWLLDPLFYMLVYIMVVSIILRRGGPDYPVFVFSGLLIWRWTSSTINQSTNCIIAKKNLINNIYIPKTIFPFIKNSVNFFYFSISITLLVPFLIIYKIPLTYHVIEIVPVIIVQYLFNFGISLWLSHLGVLYFDVDKVLSVFIRVWYYLSPGLYSLDLVPKTLQPLMWLNPLTTTMVSSRNVFLYGHPPVYLGLLVWGVLSIIIIYFGLRNIYNFDRMYAKVL